ncbi:MAG: polysaccharide biosynthesis/export family protein [bacterium]
MMNSLQKTAGMLGWTVVAMTLAGCMTGPRPVTGVNPYRPELKRSITPPAPRLAALGKKAEQVELVAPRASTNKALEAVFEQTERVLRKGDRIQVTIYAPPEPFTCPHVVDEDGRINIPLIGTMAVAGKSCGAAQRSIEKAYIDQQIYKNVTVIIVPPEGEYTVSGEVIRPGPYPLGRDQTLMQALSRAGRYTEFADQHRVMLLRNNERVEINLDDIREGKRKDIVIISGDVVEVPRSKW